MVHFIWGGLVQWGWCVQDRAGVYAQTSAACLRCSHDEAKLLICDGCEAEYHMYCLRPKLTRVPAGDWYCPKCHRSGSSDDEGDGGCAICGSSRNEAQLLICDGCEAEYHMSCLTPKLTKVPAGDWYCQTCHEDRNGKKGGRKRRGSEFETGRSRPVRERKSVLSSLKEPDSDDVGDSAEEGLSDSESDTDNDAQPSINKLGSARQVQLFLAHKVDGPHTAFLVKFKGLSYRKVYCRSYQLLPRGKYLQGRRLQALLP